ncbi:type II toxin-antitoxin system VapC family toxin [Streptomyces formicae]|uniref:Ribonuclease VapC n=1 Tax=Streptomyces formicae TaxID=1616117 RepID=A0ABY3WSX0_9ACTN|nr:type II toxin-antitoxin system VapC family toxin [Streptomyces formicae]UNM15748.1 type II toxin-antitoxin system VapC family toxin [Streptomyces formicae]
MSVIYLDTSAAIKLFKTETESEALERWLAQQGSLTVLTSDLTRTELRRALYACGAQPETLDEADGWLEDCALIQLKTATFDRAGHFPYAARLRSLDAIHCAAALSLGPAITAFVAYDKRLTEAAQDLGLPVSSPGAP